MLDLASNLLTITKSSCQIFIGVDQGFTLKQRYQAITKVSDIPLCLFCFKYNCTRAAVISANVGKFQVTSETGFEEEALLGPRSLVLETGIFNKYYEAQFVLSTNKKNL